jgi:tRNA threonylcarbamoyladenosine biosynthesis protein TsaE
MLKPGSVVWLEGDLGAGKTVFARGCITALGVTGPVTSPTFTIARRYEGGSFPISHLDLYRLADGLGGEDPGVFDPEFGAERLTIVEWPERGAGVLPDPDYVVTLEHGGHDTRRVRIVACR